MNIGQRLLELRKQKGLSQEEVAEKVGVTRQTVSKWETGESNPDFDKIVPLCDLYAITTEELLRGKKKEKIEQQEVEFDRRSIKRKTAKVLSFSIFLYFLSISWIIAASSIHIMNDEFMVSIFLLICAVATSMIVYHFVSIPKEKDKKIKNKPYKRIDEITAMTFTVIYLLVSFLTGAWHITWILWIIYSIVVEIIHLILDMKGEKNEKE